MKELLSLSFVNEELDENILSRRFEPDPLFPDLLSLYANRDSALSARTIKRLPDSLLIREESNAVDKEVKSNYA